jgi:trk system potassium uptake protein TrkA
LVEKVRSDAPVLVIGLGRFGAACAGELDRLDREVLAIDDSAELVQKWSDRVTHTVQADARNIDALRQIGAQDFQVAVVAVGSLIEASVLITANLVDLKVPQIWAKAVSQSHGKILARVGANHVIYPEREAGERVAHLVSGRMLDFIRFDDDFVLAKLYPPKFLRGVALSAKPFRYAEADTVVTAHDLVIVSGTNGDVERFAALER